MRRVRWRCIRLGIHLDSRNWEEEHWRKRGMRSSHPYALGTEIHASSFHSCRNVTTSVLQLSKFFEWFVESFEKAKIVR